MAVQVKRAKLAGDGALERASALLGRARLAVIGGLLTDIAGADAALALAEKLGGVIDHAAGEGLCRASRIMRETGGCPASMGEVRNRADIVVLVGDGPLKREPGLLTALFPKKEGLPRPGNNSRGLVLLGCGEAEVPAHIPVTRIGLGNLDLATLVARLSAAVHQHQAQVLDDDLATTLQGLAERLRAGAFPVFVISYCDLDDQVLRTVLDMVRHLCVTTRAANLSVPAPGNGDGVNLCSVWTCGLPVRTSFASGLPEHDARMYGARRLIESGEADALLWVEALPTFGVERPQGVPTVVLSSTGNGATAADDVAIEVGCPGVDHDAELYLWSIAGIGMVKATRPNGGAPTVAEVLGRITERLGSPEARA